jgi:YHS domain-containing protein
VTARLRLAAALAVFATLLGAGPAAALDPVYASWRGLAIRGTDPVAYFTEGRPVKGSREHEAEWNGATWRFASAENRRLFLESPERYAPQYGGYCAFAVSKGHTASTVPEAWDLIDGKLYLNYSLDVRDQWRTDAAGNIRKGDANWPRLLAGEEIQP